MMVLARVCMGFYERVVWSGNPSSIFTIMWCGLGTTLHAFIRACQTVAQLVHVALWGTNMVLEWMKIWHPVGHLDDHSLYFVLFVLLFELAPRRLAPDSQSRSACIYGSPWAIACRHSQETQTWGHALVCGVIPRRSFRAAGGRCLGVSNHIWLGMQQ